MCNGHGLALLWDNDFGDGSSETRAESAFLGTGNSRMRRARPPSIRTPDELRSLGMRTGLNGDELARTSRLTARVDNNAIADGFQLYLHSFVVLRSGAWAVVQQGMNPICSLARRYHWHSATVRDFTCEPHSAIVGEHQGTILNLVDAGHHALRTRCSKLPISQLPIP